MEHFLNQHERNHQTVNKIVAMLEERLNKFRIMNDDPDANQLLRGRIAEIKTLLKIINAGAI